MMCTIGVLLMSLAISRRRSSLVARCSMVVSVAAAHRRCMRVGPPVMALSLGVLQEIEAQNCRGETPGILGRRLVS